MPTALQFGKKLGQAAADMGVVAARSRLRVGDTLTLPSGAKVYIVMSADPRRPWRAHQVGNKWGVRREAPPTQVHRQAWQYYTDDKGVTLSLGESDATALALALNRVA